MDRIMKVAYDEGRDFKLIYKGNMESFFVEV